MEHTWVHSQPYAALPPFAVIGGHDCDGSPIYVGRAYHDGDQLPAKVIPSKGCAYVAYGGTEHTKSNYEILVGQGYAWIPCYGSNVPPNAVRSGFTRGGEPLYVGRGHHANSLCVGKIHPSHGCLYIPFGGMEIRLNTYEVLIMQRQENWVASTPNYTPPGAVVAGYDTDRSVIYVARAMHNGEMLPAKFVPSKGTAYVCYSGYEINKNQFEVLCGYGYTWMKSPYHSIPPNAVSTGRSRNGEPLFIGRGHHHDTYKWVHSSSNSTIPPDAVVGGNDTDGAIMYVGRAFHNGDLLVAKVLPTKHIAFVSWRGQAIPKEHFEILCGENLIWCHCYDHIVPENAVLCGQTSLGQAVYIGRGHYNGSLTVGKISSVHRALFIPFNGSEKRLESYEILVHERGPTPGWAIPAPLEEKKPLALLEEDLKPFIPTPPPPPPSYTSSSIQPTVLPQSAPVGPPPPYAPFTYTPQEMMKPAYVQNNEHNEIKPAYVEPFPPAAPIITPAETYIPPPTSSFVPAETYVPPSMPFTDYSIWVHASDEYTPPNAFCAGHDIDNSTLYICRAFHKGHMLPGKASPSHRCAYISCDGLEVRKLNFEILTGDKYHWVPAHNGSVPPNAIEGGRTVFGETLYIARSHYNGSLTPGKFQPSHGCIYIPFGGREIKLTDYEVLVSW